MRGIQKLGVKIVILSAVLVSLGCLAGCDVFATPAPTPVPSPTRASTDAVTSPAITVRQELEEQLEMLQALVAAEKGRGHDVAQAEAWLAEAQEALQSGDLSLAREKLRQAGGALGVDLP